MATAVRSHAAAIRLLGCGIPDEQVAADQGDVRRRVHAGNDDRVGTGPPPIAAALPGFSCRHSFASPSQAFWLFRLSRGLRAQALMSTLCGAARCAACAAVSPSVEDAVPVLPSPLP